LIGQSAGISGLFGYSLPSSTQVANQMGRDVTLAAIDLEAVPALNDALNTLCATLQGADARAVGKARSYAQSYTSVFGQQVPPSYIDLGNWLHLLQEGNPGAAVSQAAGDFCF